MTGKPEMPPGWEPWILPPPGEDVIDRGEEERLRRMYGLPPEPAEGDGGAAAG